MQVNCFCFDKTGTLTSDGLELACIRPIVESTAGPTFSAVDVTSCGDLSARIVSLLASCHALTHVGDALTGDPLEVKTFTFTGATLDEPHYPSAAATSLRWTSPKDYVSRVILGGVDSVSWQGTVLHQFDFVPSLQRMGVLVQEEGVGLPAPEGAIVSYVKGSPEALFSLCEPGTLPADFWQVLACYTHQGFRVLGCGWKRVSAADLPPQGSALWTSPDLRTSLESGLTFLGLIVLENQLKPASKPTISALRAQGGLALAMITGDNADAAVCVGRKCEIVEPGYRVFIGDLSPTSIASNAQGIQYAGATDNAEDDSLMCELVPAGEIGVNSLPIALASSLTTSQPRTAPAKVDFPCIQMSVIWTDVDDASRTLDPLLLTPSKVSPGKSAASLEPYRLALTGRAYAVLHDAYKRGDDAHGVFRRAILNGAVFARMSPEAKASLVEEYQATGLYVGMVGDGANDSLALRSAHVGISLSQVSSACALWLKICCKCDLCVRLQAEASVSAPFTSHIADISCVIRVLCEGRGALSTSFCLFQLCVFLVIVRHKACAIVHRFSSPFYNSMALYSTIQFSNALLAVWSNSFLSNNEYMWQVCARRMVIATFLQ